MSDEQGDLKNKSFESEPHESWWRETLHQQNEESLFQAKQRHERWYEESLRPHSKEWGDYFLGRRPEDNPTTASNRLLDTTFMSDMLKKLVSDLPPKPTEYKFFVNSEDFSRMPPDLQMRGDIISTRLVPEGKTFKVPSEKLKIKFEVDHEALRRAGDRQREMYESIAYRPRMTFAWGNMPWKTYDAVTSAFGLKKRNPNWSEEWDEWRNYDHYDWNWVGRLVMWIVRKVRGNG